MPKRDQRVAQQVEKEEKKKKTNGINILCEHEKLDIFEEKKFWSK